ncbi:hypothetical protein VTK26DRAFT_6865 [Humicola hyalothermophila]
MGPAAMNASGAGCTRGTFRNISRRRQTGDTEPEGRCGSEAGLLVGDGPCALSAPPVAKRFAAPSVTKSSVLASQ